jgi:hypothetical protein
MGILKTAMMSGAAMYGMKKITETRSVRAAAPAPPPPSLPTRREYYGQEDQYFPGHQEYHPLHSSSSPRRLQGRQEAAEYYKEDQRQDVPNSQTYYTRDNPPDYEYPLSRTSQPAYPSDGPSRYRPRGFVEPDEAFDREPSSGQSNRGDMMNNLLQQAMSSGILSAKDGQKGQGKGDLLKSLMGN